MMLISDAIIKIIAERKGNQRDIDHLLKVWAYAKTIGEQEGLDKKTQETLELAAIVHDIACPMLYEEHGSAPGNLQEEYGPPMVREFYEDSVEEEMLDRICYLVEHHHTYSNVDGLDYQILLEADFLVNAGESDKYHKAIPHFRKNVFRTQTGKALLESIYCGE